MTEPTWEQVLDSAQQAHEAGDTKAAQSLTDLAREMMAQVQPQEEKSGGMMPFVNKGIADVVGGSFDWVTQNIAQGIENAGGLEYQEPLSLRRGIEKGMDYIGAERAPREQEPKTMPEYAGRAVGENAALLLPFTATAQKLSQGAGLVAKITGSLYKSIVKHPWWAVGTEMTAGAGAGSSRYGAEQKTDSPALQSTAEIVGGVTGGVAPMVAAKTPTLLAVRLGKTLLRKLQVSFTEKGSKYRTGNFVKDQVADPSKAIAETSAETVSDLPPAVRSGEERLMALYKSYMGQDAAVDKETIETLAKAMTKLEGEMRKFGYGSPNLLAEITEKRIAALELRMDKRVVEAVKVADDRLSKLSPAESRTAESRVVRHEIEKVMAIDKVEEERLWGLVDKDIEVGTSKTRVARDDIIDSLSEAEIEDIPKVLKTHSLFKAEDDEAVMTTVNEMQGIRKKLLQVARQARANNEWNTARIANEVADSVLEDLGIVARTAQTPEAATLKTAIAASRAFKERFQKGEIGKLLGYGKEGAPAIDPDLTLKASIGRGGERGSVDLEKIALTPEAKAATSKYITRSFTKYATNKRTRALDPIKAKDWIRENDDILDHFPELKKQLSNAEQAQEIANKTTAIMEARKKALRSPKVSASAKFLNRADMGEEVKSILSKESGETAKEMVRQASKDQSGEALEGLRGGFIEHMLVKSKTGPFNDRGVKTLSGRELLGFLGQNEKVLQEVFTPKQITRMRMIGRELAKVEKFKDIKEGKPEIEMKDLSSTLLRLYFKVAGATVGRMMGTGTIQVPSLMMERFKWMSKHLISDRAQQLLHDAILSNDDELLKALLLPIDKPTAKGVKNMKIVDERLNLWLVGTGKRVMDDIQRENKQAQ